MHCYSDGRRTQFFGVVFLATLLELVGAHDEIVLEVEFFESDDLPAQLFAPDATVLRDFIARRLPPIID